MNAKRTIKYFWIDQSNKVSLDVTVEDIYFVFLNNEVIINTKYREEAEHIYESLRRS